MKSKILALTFKNEWGEGEKKTYYHSVVLEGETKPVSLGVKSVDPLPDWFKIGEELEWEWLSEEKRSIKRIAPKKGGFGGKFVDQSTSQFIVAAMNNVTAMKIAGVVVDTEDAIRGLVELAIQLKNEFK